MHENSFTKIRLYFRRLLFAHPEFTARCFTEIQILFIRFLGNILAGSRKMFSADSLFVRLALALWMINLGRGRTGNFMAHDLGNHDFEEMKETV